MLSLFDKLKNKNKAIHLSEVTNQLIKASIWLFVFCQLLLFLFTFYSVAYSIIFLLLLINLFLVAIFSIAFYFKVVKPYSMLEEDFKNFNYRNDYSLLKKNKINYSSETGKTIDTFLKSIENQDMLKTENIHAGYSVLQNQINPHFLYNTLEAIRSDALLNGVKSIADTTEALATFFRYTISNINSMVTLEAELNNSESYFVVQKFRFEDKISLKIELGDEDFSILDCKMPKLTLQPIIENAVIHGLERKLGNGSVCINVSASDNMLVIRILDDGIGMDEITVNNINEKMNLPHANHLFNETSSNESIGLLNVNSRIKIMFGDEYGLRLNSIKNFGTSVYVHLPLVKKDSVLK